MGGVENLLLGVHFMLSKMAKAPELELEPIEAQQIAAAGANVLRHYPKLIVGEKWMDIGAFGTVLAGVYGSRFYAMRDRLRSGRPAAPKPPTMQGKSPMPTAPEKPRDDFKLAPIAPEPPPIIVAEQPASAPIPAGPMTSQSHVSDGRVFISPNGGLAGDEIAIRDIARKAANGENNIGAGGTNARIGRDFVPVIAPGGGFSTDAAALELINRKARGNVSPIRQGAGGVNKNIDVMSQLDGASMFDNLAVKSAAQSAKNK